MKLVILLSGLSFALNSFSQLPEITFLQQEVSVQLTKTEQEVHVEAGKFGFQIVTEPYTNEDRNAIHLGASFRKSDLKWLKPGSNSDENPFFSPGRGLATDGPYDVLYLNGEGCHYLFFDPTEKNPRLIPIEQQKSQPALTSWSVEKFVVDGEEFPMSKLKGKTVYLMFWNDRNRDGQIEEKEYAGLTLHFE